ncbi:ankyrin repeat, SAM and basic leucine zipper domain-containing protein 1-like [Leptopilina heterotoma]|uniref:ankyrin repeat, SAM and basic leucine zipper domain-containing protein 1-like n=1 Tax=Leptopilina heterotoma TaxID=63436 RepID=UPI001CA87A04|nr:ankyrin repeat, SAM and basic leucine zipper domain-containing protein 1-like [Leptopilina heterotoma]
MYRRPGGMSDEESDDDGFTFHDDEENNSRYNKYTNERETNGEINFDDGSGDSVKGRHNYEFQAFNACMSGDISFIKEYLSSGPHIDDFLHSGWSLLLYASSASQTELVQYLLDNGANPNLHQDGFTPLMALCNCPRTTQNCLECLKILLKAKANAHASGKRRETALMLACNMREVEFVKELIRNMQSVNAADSENQTAIFFAVKANRYEIVELLLQCNAEINIKDRFGESPYDIARTKGFDKIAALLEDEEFEDSPPTIDTFDLLEWKDLFPALASKKKDKLNFEILTILYGMNLDKYKDLFRGMDLNTFLKLNEDDLEKLGMDIGIHRKKFVADLHRFHSKKWNMNSLGAIRKHLPYTIYDGVVTLGNAARQINIVGSSFRFIVNNLMRGEKENLALSLQQKVDYSDELEKTEKELMKLKNELVLVKQLANKIDRESVTKLPATFIAKKRKTYKLTIAISIFAMITIYFAKSKISKLCIE